MKLTQLIIFVLGILAVGCRAPRSDYPERPLPFHVALAPAETLAADVPLAAALEASYKLTEEEESEPAGKLELRLDSKTVTDGLAHALAKGFERVTVIPSPTDPDFARITERERARYWQKEAVRLGADLWVQPSIQYEPKIDREINEKFWLNLPLFLLGGPFCWFVGDNTYSTGVNLNADFIDVSNSRPEDPLSANVLRIPIQTEYNGSDLSFVKRAHGVGHYLASILIPAGFLARKTSDTTSQVNKEIVKGLSSDFVWKVHDNDRFFSKSERLASVEFAHAKATVSCRGDEVTVALPVSANNYVLKAGNDEIRERVPEEEDAAGHRWIRQTFLAAPDVQFLKLRLFDAQSESRTYTLRLPRQAVTAHASSDAGEAGGAGVAESTTSAQR